MHPEPESEYDDPINLRKIFALLGLSDIGKNKDLEGCFIRRRGRATCETVRKLPLGPRINIEVNASGIPCNFQECTLLALYMGMIVKDPVLAPLSFDDWRRSVMKRYKTLMCAELESKFSYSQSQVRPWVLKSLGVKWRNLKAALKAKYWDDRPTDAVIEGVPGGIDALQWATLVSFWTDECNQPTVDRLLLFRDTRTHKDGTWTSQDAKEKCELACQILAESDLTPDSGDAEANERVFSEIMGKEDPGRVRCSGFSVTPSTYYPQASSSTGCSASGSDYARFDVRITTVEKGMIHLNKKVDDIQDTVKEMYDFMKAQASKENQNQPSHGVD